MATLRAYVEKNRIKVVDCVYVDSNPNAPDWADANHFRVRLESRCYADEIGRRRTRRVMTLHFSQGYGISGEPDAVSILDCLRSDAGTVESCRSFEEWASDLGYDPDSRKAEKTYKTVQQQSAKLRKFLGDTEYQRLLYSTDGL